MGILFVHECGHFFTASFLGWKTDKICLYPYGGVSKFDTMVNVPLKEEFLVLVMGPVSQIVFVYLLSFVLSDGDVNELKMYHYFLLFVNLLPIYPLDGGRLLFLGLSFVLPFKKSFSVVIIISVVALIFVLLYFCYSFSLLLVLVFLLFGMKLWEEYKKFPYVFERFLLERKIYKFDFRKKTSISRIFEMKRDTYHFFKRDGSYLNEEDYFKNVSHIYL